MTKLSIRRGAGESINNSKTGSNSGKRVVMTLLLAVTMVHFLHPFLILFMNNSMTMNQRRTQAEEKVVDEKTEVKKEYESDISELDDEYID